MTDMPRLFATFIVQIAITNLLLRNIDFFLRMRSEPFLSRRLFIFMLLALPSCHRCHVCEDLFTSHAHPQPIRVSSLLVCVWCLETLSRRNIYPIPSLKLAPYTLSSLIVLISAVIKALEHLMVMDKLWLPGTVTATKMEI